MERLLDTIPLLARRETLLGFGMFAFLYGRPSISRAAPAGIGIRVALVIGNGGYRDGIPVLANPPNDARAIAAELKQLGFTAELQIDADRDDMLGRSRASVRDPWAPRQQCCSTLVMRWKSPARIF